MERMRKQRILIADDSEMNRSILADMLGDEYDIVEAEDGLRAVAMLQKQGSAIDLVLLDIRMPAMSGFDVLQLMTENLWIDDIPVIMISADTDPDNIARAYEMGATDFISRPFDAVVVQHRVDNTLTLYGRQKRLVNLAAEQIYEKERTSSRMIDILSHIVEFRNGERGLHGRHVNAITDLLLRQLVQITDRYPLTPDEITMISTAATIHDIGCIALPLEVLTKPDQLTDEEFAVVQSHSIVGANMLHQLPFYQKQPLVKTAYEICRWHHERYDGTGYPDGLVGEEIPISAQAVSLADVYDGLTGKRIYKESVPHEQAMELILQGKCGAFNPLLLQCLREVEDRLQDEIANVDPSVREMQTLAREMIRHKELSASERTLQLLEHERMKYNFFASLTEEIQFEYTLSSKILTLSAQGAGRLGLAEVVADPINDAKVQGIMKDKDVGRLSALLRATTPEEPVITYECKLRSGEEFRWTRIIARAIWSEEEPPEYTGVIGKAVDVHDSRLELEHLERMASHDALTGLLNHAYAKKRIHMRMGERPIRTFALAILDLDHFKAANDTYGHQFGDKVLQHMAERLNSSTRSNDIVARVGGDEFLMFLEYTGDLEPTIQRIYSGLSGGQYEEFTISVSMGVARTEDVGYDYEALFHAADQALYCVKRGGRGHYEFYDDSMEETLSVITPIDDDREKSDET